MILLGIIGVLAVLFLFASPVWLFLQGRKIREQLRRQEARIAEITDELAQLKATGQDSPETGPRAGPEATAEAGAPPPGPWTDAAAREKTRAERAVADRTEGPAGGPPRRYVLNAGNLSALSGWLRRNWFLAIAALSLALSAVFLVQYGIDQGLITPFWRVIGAAVLGIALIWAGEVIRRRWGDAGAGSTAQIPSVFSGAGIFSLFVAVLAARQLYGLITPQAALIWLLLVAATAVVLGWYYGPVLAAIGIVGAMAAPFLVGGQSAAPELFYYYFALVMTAGLLIDAIRRWAWVSAASVAAAYLAAWFLFDSGAGAAHLLAFSLLATAAAVIVPPLRLVPRHGAGSLLSLVLPHRRRGETAPGFPARVAAGAFGGACLFAAVVALSDPAAEELWLAIVVLSLLFLAAALWFREAPALADLAPVPAILFLWIIVDQSLSRGELFRSLVPAEPGQPGPAVVFWLSTVALGGSAVAGLRALGESRAPRLWAAGAALFAPLVLVVLELFWEPSRVLGASIWAWYPIACAVLMVILSERMARRDAPDRRRASYFALGALTMISLSLLLVLSKAALSVALAVMVLGAAALDRWQNMRLLKVFIYAGIAVIGFRQTFWPGLDRAFSDATPAWEIALGYAGVGLILTAAWRMLGGRRRHRAQVVVEAGIALSFALLITVALDRLFGADPDSHWGASLHAAVWAGMAIFQVYRLGQHGPLRTFRIVLATGYGLTWAVLVALLALVSNPVANPQEPVLGPPVADSLLLAFGLQAVLLALAARIVPVWQRGLVPVLVVASAGFSAAYVALEIRRLWHGPVFGTRAVLDGELYSYTLALLLAAGALLLVAFWRRSPLLRRIAVMGIGVTIAKVFLIDMSGLAGLYRVASFLGLGLSLAGLAWLDRVMTRRWEVPGRI